MSAYEQRVEPPDRKWQYLLFAAEPYETIAFKVSYWINDIFGNFFLSLDLRSCLSPKNIDFSSRPRLRPALLPFECYSFS